MFSIATRVSFEPAPAITGTRPAACSTQTRTTRKCSSADRVAASPVVPQGTSAAEPSAICQSMKSRYAISAKAPSSTNGVTSAGIDPENMANKLLREDNLPFLQFWDATNREDSHILST